MKTKFSIELEETIYNKLKELAYSEFRSPKATAEMILTKYLNEVVISN
jgi:hypothetical protein